MKTLMTNLETLGFTKETGLDGLSLNNVAVSLHWSGEEAMVYVDGEMVLCSSSEEEIIAFVKAELKIEEAAIEVSEVEYNDDLNGYIVELKDGRIVQVQFERETNRLHADYNTYFAFIDKENDYGLDLSDEEEGLFYEWMSNNKDIQDKIKELDAESI
ncbi:hypothetical protein F974_01901 [Acinetobacter sp. CIP 102159]|uniref:hypothetical protein n=1 Tax=Acinetobacter sp. CIP 102159 TaxID=1144667 RepID=UPI0002D0866D|nr:hypothetical protein [Acinetobacter sp. CIP 102159]ENU83069.1 hypothetical protein F974_01901 [Acinetobacter sp. CIP 102159]